VAERSNFDAALSRTFYEAEVWRDATWLGFPISQIPTDLMALQEVIFRARPRVIVECGTNRGGGTVFLASMLRLLHGAQGRVISVDLTEKPGVRAQLAETTWGDSITLLHGSSTAPEIVAQVRSLIGREAPVLVLLDSDHAYAHVRDELRLYHPLVTPGSYLIVFDTICRYLADVRYGRPTWAEDNPLRAVQEFLPEHPEFSVEREWEKYMATFAPYGFLRRLR
jgi:cephalosporin hydroxylase